MWFYAVIKRLPCGCHRGKECRLLADILFCRTGLSSLDDISGVSCLASDVAFWRTQWALSI